MGWHVTWRWWGIAGALALGGCGTLNEKAAALSVGDTKDQVLQALGRRSIVKQMARMKRGSIACLARGLAGMITGSFGLETTVSAASIPIVRAGPVARAVFERSAGKMPQIQLLKSECAEQSCAAKR